MMSDHARRATVPSLRIAALLVAFGALASCSSSTDVKTVSSVAKLHLVFSNGQTLDVTSNKEETRIVHVPVGTPVTVTGTFFRADGTADPTVTAAAFKMVGQVTIFGGSPPITYVNSTSDSFSGTLTAPVATVAIGGALGAGVAFQLVNVSSGNVEFGPWTVNIIAP
jgi:hypothetical protein